LTSVILKCWYLNLYGIVFAAVIFKHGYLISNGPRGWFRPWRFVFAFLIWSPQRSTSPITWHRKKFWKKRDCKYHRIYTLKCVKCNHHYIKITRKEFRITRSLIGWFAIRTITKRNFGGLVNIILTTLTGSSKQA
jgi:hypothetical protein